MLGQKQIFILYLVTTWQIIFSQLWIIYDRNYYILNNLYIHRTTDFHDKWR